MYGSSPLVRGQHTVIMTDEATLRIIPARAGPTSIINPLREQVTDHPRSCGANSSVWPHYWGHTGSSPLVRGQPCSVGTRLTIPRIIPARAGPTWVRTSAGCACSDHPRSCGANFFVFDTPCVVCGSSPLVRGQPAVSHMSRAAMRIIPARAGPTITSASGKLTWTDHPRSCGAN